MTYSQEVRTVPLANESLQLTGARAKEVVVAAALVRTVSNLQLPREYVARS